MAYIQKNNPFSKTKKKDFKPHWMYHKEKADTYQEHLDLEKKGYGHTPHKKK